MCRSRPPCEGGERSSVLFIFESPFHGTPSCRFYFVKLCFVNAAGRRWPGTARAGRATKRVSAAAGATTIAIISGRACRSRSRCSNRGSAFCSRRWRVKRTSNGRWSNMHIRDRIKELRRVPAAQLQPNPKNWRTHPKAQQDALKAILAEVGYADALLARETDTGRLMLIDGHLRA